MRSPYQDWLAAVYDLDTLVLSPEGGCLAFVRLTASKASHSYERQVALMTLADGRLDFVDLGPGNSHVPLTFAGPDSLLWADGNGQTSQLVHYAFSTGQRRILAHLPFAIEAMQVTQEGGLLAAARSSYPSEDEDCLVYEELPAFLEGVGTMSGRRCGLYLIDPETGDHTGLTHPDFHLSKASLGDEQLTLVGQVFQDYRTARDGIIQIDLRTKTTRSALSPSLCHVADAIGLADGSLVFLATDGSRHGLAQALDLMWMDALERGQDHYRVLMAADTMEAPAFFDLSEQTTASLLALDEGFLFCQSGLQSHFYLFDQNLALKDHISFQGKVGAFCKGPGERGQVFFVATPPLKASEIYRLDLAEGRLEQVTDLGGQFNAICQSLHEERRVLDSQDGPFAFSLFSPPQGQAGPALLLLLDQGRASLCQPSFLIEAKMWLEKGFWLLIPHGRSEDGSYKRPSYKTRYSGDLGIHALKESLDALFAWYPAINSSCLGLIGRGRGGLLAQKLLGEEVSCFARASLEATVSDWITHAYASDLGYLTGSLMFSPHALAAADQAWHESPGRLANRISCPLLIIQGMQARAFPIEDMMTAYAGAIKAGSQVRMLMVEGEYAKVGAWSLGHQLQRLEVLDQWFAPLTES